MLDEKTIFWLGRRKRDIKNKFGYFCRHCGQYKRQFVEWCNDEYYCPTCTRKYDYIDAAEFESRVSAKMAEPWILSGGKPHCPHNGCIVPMLRQKLKPRDAERICAWCVLKHARIAVEAEMIAEGKGPGRRENK